MLNDLVGQVFALFVLTVAAAEAAIGLATPGRSISANRGSIAVADTQHDEGLSGCRRRSKRFFVLLILVVPGFVAARLFKSPLPNALVSERQFIVLTVFLGILVHLIALPFTIRIWPEIAALVVGAGIG